MTQLIILTINAVWPVVGLESGDRNGSPDDPRGRGNYWERPLHSIRNEICGWSAAKTKAQIEVPFAV